MIDQDIASLAMESIRLPHTNVIVPLHYFDDKAYQFVSIYKRQINGQPEWEGKSIWITFEGVGHVAKVYINGTYLGEHLGGYTSFRFELTSHMRINEVNEVTVVVDSRESNNIPPFGNVIDYMTFGGSYREVYLSVGEKTHISDVFVKTLQVCEPSKMLSLQCELNQSIDNS